MRNTTLNMVTAFVISVLAGYWIPLFFKINISQDFDIKRPTHQYKLSPILSEKTTEINYSEENYNPPMLKNYPICDPFTDKNMCILQPSLRNILKSDSQKNQYMYVLKKLDELQLPHELALLPIIESKYNPYAISPRGAGGVWQLMPNTAKEYGLLDHERFELEPSTTAALLFLKQLHQQFGNWELAIAAYNAGSKRVQDALQENPSAKHVKDLSLPIETKNYVNIYNKMTLAHKK